MDFKFDKALITGGAGFIGSHLAETLIEHRKKIIVLDDLSSGNLSNIRYRGPLFSFVKGDIRDRRVVAETSRGCDIIFHLAAIVSVPFSLEKPFEAAMVNDIGTLNVMESARKNNIEKVVIASSSAVYGDSSQYPQSENHAVYPMSHYALHKLMGEHYAHLYNQLYGMSNVCLRFFNVYGPRQVPSSPYAGVISIFIDKAIKKEKPTIYGDGDQSRDFIFVKDVVKALLIAGSQHNGNGGVYNIGTGRETSINQLWKTIARLSDCTVEPDYAPPRSGDIYKSAANIKKYKDEFKFECDYTFLEGIQKTIDWFRNE